MIEKPYLGMLGYTAEGRPFMKMNVDEAKDVGKKNDLSEYILVPRRVDGQSTDYNHQGYIRDEAGEYRWTYPRVAVFCHLLDTKHDWVLSKEELKPGGLFDKNPMKP